MSDVLFGLLDSWWVWLTLIATLCGLAAAGLYWIARGIGRLLWPDPECQCPCSCGAMSPEVMDLPTAPLPVVTPAQSGGRNV